MNQTRDRRYEAESDIRLALHLTLQQRREKNPNYSLRAFARALGVQVSALSEILAGKRAMSHQMALTLIKGLPIEEPRAASLLAELRDDALANSDKFVSIETVEFSLIDKWYYLAILTFCDLSDFDGKIESMSERLKLDLATTRSAVAKLIELGYLQSGDGRISSRAVNLTTGTNLSEESIRASHAEHLHLASKALETVEVDQRDFTFVNLATDPALLLEARRRIKNFRRNLMKFLERGNQRTAVLRLGIQLFPLTKRDDETKATL